MCNLLKHTTQCPRGICSPTEAKDADFIAVHIWEDGERYPDEKC